MGRAVWSLVGLVSFVIIIVGALICFFSVMYYTTKKTNRLVQAHVMATTPTAGATTGVTSNQTGAFTAASVSYHTYQEPVYRDAQLSSQDVPPSYTSATPFPRVVEVRFC